MADDNITRDALAVVLDVPPRRDVILRQVDAILGLASKDDHDAATKVEQVATLLGLDPFTASPDEILREVCKALGEQS